MKSVIEYIEKNDKWTEGLNRIREEILKTELEENIKWGAPVYSLNGKNVCGMAAFKNHFGIWFFQGVFLKDEENLLVNAQENKTKALRQMRFESIDQLPTISILNYVKEAIENQKLGKEIKADRTKKLEVPTLLENDFKSNSDFSSAFYKLSPGKQKEYANHIAEAKREATQISRLEKIRPMVMEGKGLHDKYKNC